AVILGDNIFEKHFKKDVAAFKKGARVFFKKMDGLHRFGVPVFDQSGKRVIRIEEKPQQPKSAYGQTGFYLYDGKVFDDIKKLKPSARGELEITDINNRYLKRGGLSYGIIDGFWSDAGTFESLFKATAMRAKWAQ
ncbi:MAG: sugar phosphate nucleotidyltransferase, partial [Patescibacteria group bacterium]